jgi:hypothetical protein
MRDVKVQRRRLIRCAERAFRTCPELSDFRQGTSHGASVPALFTDVRRKLAFAFEHLDELAPVGVSRTPATTIYLGFRRKTC